MIKPTPEQIRAAEVAVVRARVMGTEPDEQTLAVLRAAADAEELARAEAAAQKAREQAAKEAVRAERKRLAAMKAAERAEATRERRNARRRKDPSEYKKRGAERRHDYDEIARLHVEEKMTPNKIAEHLGINPHSVRYVLKTLGVYTPAPPGYALQDFCKRGHDMSVHGRRRKTGKQARYCGECHRLRAQNHRQKKQGDDR